MNFDKTRQTLNGVVLQRLCPSIDVSERHGKRVYVDIERDIALFRINGTVYAVSNICPHKREAVIAQGAVVNGTVTCPMHSWCFDIKSGKNMASGGGLRTYTVVEHDGYVWLEV